MVQPVMKMADGGRSGQRFRNSTSASMRVHSWGRRSFVYGLAHTAAHLVDHCPGVAARKCESVPRPPSAAHAALPPFGDNAIGNATGRIEVDAGPKLLPALSRIVNEPMFHQPVAALSLAHSLESYCDVAQRVAQRCEA
jgi:hypothetical protein